MSKIAKTMLAPLLAAAGLFATVTEAEAQRVRAVAPRPAIRADLPTFGMNTFNDGYGECVVSVRYGGVAWRLGLERGDQILSINNFPLRYHGSWWEGLGLAMDRGGHVLLTIRDVRTGRLTERHVNFPVYGPVTPKVVDPIVVDPVCEGPVYPGPGFPGGPVTPKLQKAPVAPKFEGKAAPTAKLRQADYFRRATQQFAQRFGWTPPVARTAVGF